MNRKVVAQMPVLTRIPHHQRGNQRNGAHARNVPVETGLVTGLLEPYSALPPKIAFAMP